LFASYALVAISFESVIGRYHVEIHKNHPTEQKQRLFTQFVARESATIICVWLELQRQHDEQESSGGKMRKLKVHLDWKLLT
jgi:hypothetical protein